jgi:hypothetical protein
MQERRCVTLIAIFASILMAGGAFGQEVPDEPEVPQAPEAPSEPETPETPEAPEASEAVEAPAAPPSLTFETSVDFEPVKKIALEGRAGEIDLLAVEFTVSAAKGGVLGTSDADLKATVVVLLDCATEAAKKAKLNLTVSFLDAEGNVIDRVDNGISLKSGTKTVETKHTTLKYVVPLIKTAKITAVAK